MKPSDSTSRPLRLGCRCVGRRHALRSFVGLAGFAALGGVLAGCKDGGDAGAGPATPKDFDTATACELDGMTLADYPGPKGQIQVESPQPATLFYCDTVELLSELLRPEQVRKVKAAYVQDMGSADWDAPRGHWTDARSAWYVVGGRRKGSMGPTIASFAQAADAQAFTQTWGGKVLPFAQITPELVDLRGGSSGDGRM